MEASMKDEGLNAKQEAAIDLMMAGMTDVEVASELGIARQSVSRWRTGNSTFIEALEMRRALMRERHMYEMSELVERAIDVVRKNLAQGDEKTQLKVAMVVLKMSGLQGYAKPTRQRDKIEIQNESFQEIIKEVLIESAHKQGLY